MMIARMEECSVFILGIRYGFITSTPKQKWRNTDVLSVFKGLNIPVGFNTDVQAAAIGELRHGNHGYGGRLVEACSENVALAPFRAAHTSPSVLELEWESCRTTCQSLDCPTPKVVTYGRIEL